MSTLVVKNVTSTNIYVVKGQYHEHWDSKRLRFHFSQGSLQSFKLNLHVFRNPRVRAGVKQENLSFILNVRLVVGGDLEIVKGQKHEHLSCQKFDKYERLDCKSLESNFFTEVFNHLPVQVNFYVFRIPRVGVELAIKGQKHQHQDYKSSEIAMMFDWVNESDTSVETHLPTKEKIATGYSIHHMKLK